MSELGLQWDEEKRLANLHKHGLDFRDAGKVMVGAVDESSFASWSRNAVRLDRFIGQQDGGDHLDSPGRAGAYHLHAEGAA